MEKNVNEEINMDDDAEKTEEVRLMPAASKDYVLPVSILVAGAMIAGSIIYLVGSNKGAAPKIDSGAANIGGGVPAAAVGGGAPQISGRDVILGDTKAPVTLIEYGDYQCPFCGRFFTQVEQQLRENYIQKGKVKMAFRDFQFLGPESTAAAEAAACANDQSKFWAYHDAIYTAEIADGSENNGNLTRDLFLQLAGDLKMDTAAFASCIDSRKYSAQVSKDAADAQIAGVNSTPTTFVNGVKLQGALPYAQFAAAIDNALKAK